MTARLHITRFRKANDGLLSKRITLGDDGKPVSDGSPCQMWEGTATRVEITRGAEGLADLISDLDSSDALGLGVHSAEAEQIKLVLDKHVNPEAGTYSRTLRFLSYQQGKPAVGLFDHDRKGMPDDVAAKIDALGGFEGMMAAVLPGLPGYARVIRSSTSSGLFNKKTGEQYPAGDGCHLYFFAQDGTDIDRFLRAMLKRAWLAGFGWINLSKAGSCLIRGPIDIAVGSPERLVFEGAPLVAPPLTQDQAKRRPIAHAGEFIDTRTACPDLNAEEERQYQALVAAAKAALKPEIEKAVEAAAERLAKERGIKVEQARKAIEASHSGELLSWDSVVFDDPEIGEVEVADILADPARYHGETLADPQEGREYGRAKAQIYHNGGADVRINSFAHGGCVYRLHHNLDYMMGAIEKAGKDAATLLAALMPFAPPKLDPVTKERLRNRAADIAKVGRRTVKDAIKASLAKARTEEREHRAKNATKKDGRPKADRQSLMLVGGERLEAVAKLEEVLRDPANIKKGAIVNRGQTQMRISRKEDPFKLKVGRSEIRMPGGLACLAPAKHQHLQAQLDTYFAFCKTSKEGDIYAVDCPGELAQYVLANADFREVTAIRQAPAIRQDGSILDTPGYDIETGIFYAPDIKYPPIPANPTKEDCAAALTRLLRPFRDFPFVTETDRHAVVAEVLTSFVRPLITIAPLFVHDATEAGTGKTKLFEVVSIIATGAKPAMLNAETLRDETELRKQLSTLTLGAAPFAIFDNAARGERLKSPGLANFLTAAVYGDRLLGTNEEIKAPTCTIVGISGNAIEPEGDLTRRTIAISLDAGCERPETRDFDFDPVAEAERDRGELVVAALTMLRGHALAGRPKRIGSAFGSFEEWDRLVAGAIVYAGGHDVVKLLEKTRKDDPEREGLAEVLRMLVGIEAVEGQHKRCGEIIAAVRKRVNAAPFDADGNPSDPEADEWMGILKRLGKDGNPDTRRLGNFLAKHVGRVVKGQKLAKEYDDHAKVNAYYVEQMANEQQQSAGLRGSAGMGSEPEGSGGKKFEESEKETPPGNTAGGNPAKPRNPANANECVFCHGRIKWQGNWSEAGVSYADGSAAHNPCHEKAWAKQREPKF